VGVAYGAFDLERLLHTLDVDANKKRAYICTLEKGVDSLDSFRISRFFMHSQVYQHHVNSIAEAMIRRATEIARRNGEEIETSLSITNPDFLTDYLSLDDNRFLQSLMNCGEDKVAELAKAVEERRLFKIGCKVDIVNHPDAPMRRVFSKIE
jgi:HD superfamily phosphohydrolase